MSRASAKGQKFERLIANWLKFRLNRPDIDIRPKNGMNDRGDIGGVYTALGAPVVIEAKSVKRFDLAGWLDEARNEANNADAPIGVVIFKRPRTQKPEEQYVLMTGETFARLLEGGGWDDPEAAA